MPIKFYIKHKAKKIIKKLTLQEDFNDIINTWLGQKVVKCYVFTENDILKNIRPNFFSRS